MYQANVNGKTFEITSANDTLTVNGEVLSWDVVTVEKGYFHILWNAKSYRAEVVEVDVETKTCSLKINGRIYTVQLKDKFDLLLEKMGISGQASNKINNIKAPMPGLIIDLRVKEGDTVNAGDALLVLEAMKMENIIKAPGQAVVKSVKVKKGDSVEKSQVLIEF